MLTTITRWTLATVVLGGLAWLSASTGNQLGTFLLLCGILTFVAIYGGHSKRQ